MNPVRLSRPEIPAWASVCAGIGISALAGLLGSFLGAAVGSEQDAARVWRHDGHAFVILGSGIGVGTALPVWGRMLIPAFRARLRRLSAWLVACAILATAPVGCLAYGLWSGM